MLDMQRNFMIGLMGGFSNYEASHVYSQHSKTRNGLAFDILDGIGSKIEKGTDLLKSRLLIGRLNLRLTDSVI